MLTTKEEARNRNIARGALGVLGIGLLAFVGMNLYPLVHGPSIDLSTVSNGDTLRDPMLRLSGRAKFTKDLIVNGTPVLTAPDGTFEEKLVLNPGFNLITVSGRDRFGTTTQFSYSVMLEEDEAQILTLRNPLPSVR